MNQPSHSAAPARPAPGFRSRWWLLLITVVALIAVLALRQWNPSGPDSPWPACALHELTGWWCPGCGATRAVGHVVRGDFSAAMHSNGLVLITLAVGFVIGAWAWWLGRWPGPAWMYKVGLTLLIVAAVVFTVLRNRADGAWLRPPSVSQE